MTKKEWMEYLEKTWDAAQKEAWSEPQFECPRCGHCCKADPARVGEVGVWAEYERSVAAAESNKVAKWMMDQGYATGHGETVEDLLKELTWQIQENEREACAKVAESFDPNMRWSNYGKYIAKTIRNTNETREF